MLPLWGNDIVRLRHTVMFCSPSVTFTCARFERKHHAAYAAHHCEAASLAAGEQSCALRAHKPQFGASDFYHLLPSPVEKTRNQRFRQEATRGARCVEKARNCHFRHTPRFSNTRNLSKIGKSFQNPLYKSEKVC